MGSSQGDFPVPSRICDHILDRVIRHADRHGIRSGSMMNLSADNLGEPKMAFDGSNFQLQ